MFVGHFCTEQGSENERTNYEGKINEVRDLRLTRLEEPNK